jgi:hypothetical protein
MEGGSPWKKEGCRYSTSRAKISPVSRKSMLSEGFTLASLSQVRLMGTAPRLIGGVVGEHAVSLQDAEISTEVRQTTEKSAHLLFQLCPNLIAEPNPPLFFFSSQPVWASGDKESRQYPRASLAWRQR